MNADIFVELSAILAITVLSTGVIRLLRQPTVIGYIISGIIAGPLILNIIESTQTLQAFSHIGVALLLFLVGLNLNPKVIREVGKISLLTGIGQVLFTSTIGFLIARALGFDSMVSAYLAIALAFSSTIVIMKLLSDKRDLDTLYGRISIGFLIVQDFIAILLLLLIASPTQGGSITQNLLQISITGAGSIALLLVFSHFFLARITKAAAKSQEFLLLFSLTWCFVIASAFDYLGFSIEAGALLAGVTLSMSPYHLEISSRMKPLRDFFLTLFFILLGSQMVFANVMESIIPIAILSAFVLIGNPLIVMVLMGLLGYTKRTGFLAGLTVAQISEFSLILIALGIDTGHIPQSTLSVVTAIALITFAGSTYMIIHSGKLYRILSPLLTIFERKGKKADEHGRSEEQAHDILLFGYNRIGYDILQSLMKIKRKFLIIDYDPQTIAHLAREGYDCRYGDADDPELLESLDFKAAKMVISTIPETETNLLLINKAKEENPSAIIAVVAHQIDDATMLYDAGATYVIMPHFLGGRHFSTMIEENELSMDHFLQEKIAHLEHIKARKDLGHEHPRIHH